MHLELSTKRAKAHFVAVSLSPVLCDPLDAPGPAGILCPRAFPGMNTGVGCHFLLQGIFPAQGSNPSLPHLQSDSLPLSPLGSSPRRTYHGPYLYIGASSHSGQKGSVRALTLCGFFGAAAAGRLPQQAAARGKEAG